MNLDDTDLQKSNKNLDAAHDLIYLVQCALSKTNADLSKLKCSLTTIYKTAKLHSLDSLASFALENSNDAKNDPAYPAFIEARNISLSRTVMFNIERAALENFLEENGIPYMPLKGILIKDLYPKAEMRQMADNDIWYDIKYQKQVANWFFKRGYTGTVGKAYEDRFQKEPMFNFGMHTALYGFEHENSWRKYYEDKTKHLLPQDGKKSGMRFSDDDLYVYITSHEYKHYTSGGMGLRSLVDTYLLLKSIGDKMDRKYVNAELEKLGIAEFEKCMVSLSFHLFGNSSSESSLQYLTSEDRENLENILLWGTYGTKDTFFKNKLKKFGTDDGVSTSKAKLRYLKRWMFPTHEFMKEHFHAKYFWLLPFAYVYRWAVLGIPSAKSVLADLIALAKVKE